LAREYELYVRVLACRKDEFPFMVPVIIFIAISGTDTVISKKHKKNDAGKDKD